MRSLSNAVYIGSLATVMALTACGGSAEEGAEVEGEGGPGAAIAEPSPEAVAAASALTSRLGESEITLVPTQRGSAQVNYTQPQARRQRDFIITTFRIRNQAENAIAGFQVDEFWFDRDGNTVTGANVRFREPIMPGEVKEIVLEVPRNPAMDRSNYEFTHQNGDIEATLIDELPEPEPEEEEEEEGEESESES